jgi:peptidoglycan/LPS O-acetylase OafA/YrhL
VSNTKPTAPAAQSVAPQVQQRQVWLDAIRALSAVAVCAGHLRAATWVDYEQLAAPGLAEKLFYLCTGLGHQAVIVFFVLSGYFVGGSVLRAGPAFRARHYAVTRVARLWAVLLPALAFTALADALIVRQAPGALAGDYAALWGSGPDAQHPYSTASLTLLANVFFLQTLVAPVWGSNGPLWSLAYEFWFYVCFPLLTCAVGLTGQALQSYQRLCCGLAAVVLLCVLPQAVRIGFVYWLMGVCVAVWQTRLQQRARPGALTAALVFFGGALLYTKVPRAQTLLMLPPDAVLAFASTALFVVLVTWGVSSGSPYGLAGLLRRTTVMGSEVSYSLYAYHFPWVVLVGASLVGTRQWSPSLGAAVAFLGLLALLLLGACAFWWLFERQTHQLRRWLSRLIRIK